MRFLALALVIALSAFGSSAAQDQERGKPRPELDSHGQEPEPKQKGFTIGVNVDLVIIHTSVYDKQGVFVSGLKKENFRIFEDGVEQSIVSFSQEDVPVSLGIVLDTSGSMRNKINLVNQAALTFIKASNPEDQVFLIGFNDQVELMQDYTNDIDEITDALDNVIVSGGTALYDALYLSVQKAQSGKRPKKAVIVISDGEDRDSYYKLDEMIAKVQESDVQIYSVGFLNAPPDKGLFGRWSKSVPEKAHDALQRISDDTGGKAFFPKKVEELRKVVSEIAHELRNQYSIGYVSSNPVRDGSYRRIKVTLDPSLGKDMHARYRRGYTAPKGAVTHTSQKP